MGRVRMAEKNLLDACQRVRIRRALVPSNPFDPRESKGKSARVTVAALDLIERDLKDDLVFYQMHPALFALADF